MYQVLFVSTNAHYKVIRFSLEDKLINNLLTNLLTSYADLVTICVWPYLVSSTARKQRERRCGVKTRGTAFTPASPRP